MARRSFSEDPVISGRLLTLRGAEAHHLLHVLRVASGDRLVVFDGYGDEFDAEVTTCGRATVDVHVGTPRRVDRELAFPLTLGCAIPKGDRSRWIVEKSVELGVTRIVPLITARSQRREEVSKVAQKLRRYVIEASKQCGRNRLMSIGQPCIWQDWLQMTENDGPSQRMQTPQRWIAHPGGRPLNAVVQPRSSTPTYIGLGPEGGLTEVEAQHAIAAGWELIDLGPRICESRRRRRSW